METKPDLAAESMDHGEKFKDEDGEEEESSYPECPLFMDGLPSDFSTNPQLAAIASLMDDDDEDEEKDKITAAASSRVLERQPQDGGGKARCVNSRQRRQANSAPYTLPGKAKTTKTTVGETQLFLKMWKL